MDQVAPIRLYSKSSVSVDWTCPRKFYLNYECMGHGIVKPSTSLELFVGSLKDTNA